MKATKVTSRKNIDFPSLGWSIRKGEVKELPADESAAEVILSNQYISPAPDAEQEQEKPEKPSKAKPKK